MIPPTNAVILRPADLSTWAVSAEILVFPWVPAMAIVKTFLVSMPIISARLKRGKAEDFR